MTSNIHIYQAAPSRTRPDETVDPITTEIPR